MVGYYSCGWALSSSAGFKSGGVSFPDTGPQHHNHNDNDNFSVGQTVASSTYGEDRQKVVHQTILDPYGDKGQYTGIILRSTGM